MPSDPLIAELTQKLQLLDANDVAEDAAFQAQIDSLSTSNTALQAQLDAVTAERDALQTERAGIIADLIATRDDLTARITALENA